MCIGCYGSDQGWDEHKMRSLGTLFMDKGFLERLSAERVGGITRPEQKPDKNSDRAANEVRSFRRKSI
jgi:hypothetical protein